ncbi:MAG: class I SAM-dependent methyltransferase [Anaerolineae bacterium]|nr:class I SAM-dependent methyltransferase [Anaerolineae bacterium]
MQFELITDRRIMDECYRQILYTEHLVIDLGAKNRMNKFLKQFREKPILARYFCTDIQTGTLDFVSDIHAVPIAANTVDAVICNAVIEHVQQPWVLAQEIYRILRPGGVAYLYAPFLYPYHAENTSRDEHVGGYDFYRFTADGLRYLFRDFSVMKLSPVEYGISAWWRLATYYRFYRTYPYVLRLQRFLERRAGHPIGVSQTTGYDICLEK